MREKRQKPQTRRKPGTIEVFGIVGLAIWLLTLVVRKTGAIENASFNWFWFAPNFGGAWFATACLKQFFAPCAAAKPILPIAFTVKTFLAICLGVVLLAVINEWTTPLQTGGRFDLGDLLSTILAEAIVFFAVVARNGKQESAFEA